MKEKRTPLKLQIQNLKSEKITLFLIINLINYFSKALK